MTYPHVAVNDTIQQNLTASRCSSIGHCTWLLSVVDETTGQTTSYTVGSEVAFVVILNAVMEVPRETNCDELPTDEHAAFRNLVVTGNTGPLDPAFGDSVTNPQFSVSINSTSTQANILWKA